MRHMFVVAHPDDEVLGAGAFIHQAIKNGHDVHVVILNADFEKTRREMFKDIERSHDLLGITSRSLYSYKNMNFMNENHREMVESIEAEITRFCPDNIFTHFDADIHNDHRVTSICTQQAARLWQRHSEGHKPTGLYFMEVQSSTNWSRTPFKPDTYVMVDEKDVQAKNLALAVYNNVVRPVPHPRSSECIIACAVVRGAEIGYPYAEAFVTAWRDKL